MILLQDSKKRAVLFTKSWLILAIFHKESGENDGFKIKSFYLYNKKFSIAGGGFCKYYPLYITPVPLVKISKKNFWIYVKIQLHFFQADGIIKILGYYAEMHILSKTMKAQILLEVVK